ncbi:TIGR02281 family clan AA aspartic protease [Candidatus Anaplasma sp. TIGMIC]|uniref:retropepsin-like aspartic protease family protein n=1 Tax=Candidatus Anaplasma sp. TIGMIC TaxID=3020713 RepID=UPI00232ED143|nr:TIGR02281 family clan AA aspartic protease [Candidatus Anaplasma sp. TIGMIC]MDB1135012.1 TIGR02281 family clan AA aspartic protease [Candidatus Anaplasma sp. TIGMIC]
MKSAKYIVFWLGLTVGIAFVYDVRHKILQNTGATAVSIASPVHGRGVSFRKSSDGHFYILAAINGENIRFLVDTGATDVVLSYKDAQRIGAHMRPVTTSKTYHTANGSIQASYFLIPEISIGNLIARNVGASISTSPLETSLLGMSFLKNFQFVMKKDELVLYQN